MFNVSTQVYNFLEAQSRRDRHKSASHVGRIQYQELLYGPIVTLWTFLCQVYGKGRQGHSPMKEFVKDKFHTAPVEQDPTGSHGTNRHSPIRAL